MTRAIRVLSISGFSRQPTTLTTRPQFRLFSTCSERTIFGPNHRSTPPSQSSQSRHQPWLSKPSYRQPSAIRMSSTTNTTTQPNFSPGSDPSTLAATLAPLLIANGGRWTLTADGLALERSVKFKTFAKTWDFMTAVSLQCKLKNHHPEWSNVYNTTFIRWTTHHPKGLSAKDIELASICDSLAKDFGEVIEEAPPAQQQQQQQQQAEGTTTPSGDNDGAACPMFMPGLANRAVGSAEDCCIPKSSKK